MPYHILVIGGAGYIGSHMVKLLWQKNCYTTVLDDLSSGHRDAVLHGEFVHGNMADTALLGHIMGQQRIDAVMHFASHIQVGESVTDPAKYYRNNLSHTLTLLDAMREHGCKHLIFSSTAAIFGEPLYCPIDEAHPRAPINPYGHSKCMVEQILADYTAAYGLSSTSLRYFNAAGADPEGQLGERHHPETHLIPLVLQTATGSRPHLNIYGNDYDTPDGTCIRDYIHVNDLCQAHWLALQQQLQIPPRSTAYNLGNGNGYSVQEVITSAEHITGKTIPAQHCPRRPGDPARLVANAARAHQELGWQPAYPDLASIIGHAWNYLQMNG